MAEILDSPLGDTHPCGAKLYGPHARQIAGRNRGLTTARRVGIEKSHLAGPKHRADAKLRKF